MTLPTIRQPTRRRSSAAPATHGVPCAFVLRRRQAWGRARHTACTLGSVLAVLGACSPSTDANLQAEGFADERWRISIVRAAPWVTTDATVSDADWVGAAVRISSQAVRGPGVLHCDTPFLDSTRTPPQGLFQGSLPEPVVAQARELGFPAGDTPGLRITCSAGVFDAHAPDSTSLLLALDNMILTLDRAPGALAPDTSPEGAVQRLLEAHFAGRLAFTPVDVARTAPHLSNAFRAAIARYFELPTSPDEAPIVNGDLFTDSQEVPRRFAVGQSAYRDGYAEVPVSVRDGWVAYTLTYRLVREAGTWRVDDLLQRAGDSARQMLEGAHTTEP
jgi:hypothetical protein